MHLHDKDSAISNPIPTELWPLPPSWQQAINDDGRLQYRYPPSESWQFEHPCASSVVSGVMVRGKGPCMVALRHEARQHGWVDIESTFSRSNPWAKGMLDFVVSPVDGYTSVYDRSQPRELLQHLGGLPQDVIAVYKFHTPHSDVPRGTDVPSSLPTPGPGENFPLLQSSMVEEMLLQCPECSYIVWMSTTSPQSHTGKDFKPVIISSCGESGQVLHRMCHIAGPRGKALGFEPGLVFVDGGENPWNCSAEELASNGLVFQSVGEILNLFRDEYATRIDPFAELPTSRRGVREATPTQKNVNAQPFRALQAHRSAADIGQGVSLTDGCVREICAPLERGIEDPPPGYIAIERNDLYMASLEGRTWHMLGSASAAHYVSGFFPDVDTKGIARQRHIASEPARRRANLSLWRQDKKVALLARPSAQLSRAALPKSNSSDMQQGHNEETRPQDAEEANRLGTEATMNGENERALRMFTHGLTCNPDENLRAMLLSNRGSVCSRLLRFRETLEDADKVIQLNPKWPRGYTLRAAALVGMGRKAEALPLLEKALELDPTDEDAKLDLQVEKANIPAQVRVHLEKLKKVSLLSENDLSGSKGSGRFTGARGASVLKNPSSSLTSAMEHRNVGMRTIILEDITLENLPGDIFGRCKPFLVVSVGNFELKTKILTTCGGEDLLGSLEKVGYVSTHECIYFAHYLHHYLLLVNIYTHTHTPAVSAFA